MRVRAPHTTKMCAMCVRVRKKNPSTIKVWWFHPILCLIFIFVPWDFQFCPEFLQLHITFSIINFGFSNGKKIDHLKHFNNKKGPCYLLYQKYCDLCIAGLFMFIHTSFFYENYDQQKRCLYVSAKACTSQRRP